FPLEWNVATVESRYNWLKPMSSSALQKAYDILCTRPEGVPALLADAYFASTAVQVNEAELLAHIKALCFDTEAQGLPSGRVWHFEPREFITHFRTCGWLSIEELASTFPKYMFYTSTGNTRTAITKNGQTYVLSRSEAIRRIKNHTPSLNQCLRKYIGGDKNRIAIFLSQVLLETAQWRNIGGNKRLMHEWGFGAYSPLNPATEFYTAFYGRGIMQLTWASNYRTYGDYRKLPDVSGDYIERLTPTSPRITQASLHYTAHPNDGGCQIKWFPRYDPDFVAEDIYSSCDSGGLYWVSKKFSEGYSINRISDKGYSSANIGSVNRLVNGGGNGYYERQAYTVYMLRFLTDDTANSEIVDIVPPSPKKAVQANMKCPG
ncbi:hypothetical protein ACFFJ3_20850, partial [Serratia aquatilis]